MRLLVVDDEPGWRDSLVELLEDADYEVEAAGNGEEALKLLKDGPGFDAVLSDIRMPVMDGMELLRRMVRGRIMTPTILITGHGDVQTSVEALKLGAVDLILKPFAFHVLQSALDRLKVRQQETNRQTELLGVSNLKLRLLVPSRPDLVAATVQTLRSLYRPLCESNQVPVHLIDLCLQESLTNSVIHGNLELPSSLKDESWEQFEEMVASRMEDPAFKDRQVRIQVDLDAEMLRVSLEDEGPGFDPSAYRGAVNASPTQTHGRGLLLIKGIMDAVEWSDSGNRITMIKRWEDA